MSDPKRTGTPSTSEASLEASPVLSRLAALISLYEELEAFVGDLTLTDFISVIALLRGEDHAALAGLVTHFMDAAMNMSMGDD